MQCIIGIDEAGRGPLAGPVAVGVVCVPVAKSGRALHPLLKQRGKRGKVRDSKQMSAVAREACFKELQKAQKEGSLFFSATLVATAYIDRHGIVPAVRLGIRRSLAKLNLNPGECLILLDGSLAAPSEFLFQKTIIRGDETEPIIALASIAAKVTRDRLMIRLHKKYPEYRFDLHKGYGTKLHRDMIRKQGLCELHRKTFCGRLTR